ncbi:hypothetical protein [Haliangium ochraceum]|uniref:Uncharacterized protein n=1 Tax=Haliangium ochraceum (strain DSM 14365 / JCM 11303 / SMP-2) TaxID=502025 RepID=D0LLY1_HALO1|nr:hypothetical protein [Haliangium ochraceum]ACY15159.1 conserved hypothetical protein [Haliangium ochraceum DSM 14365]
MNDLATSFVISEEQKRSFAGMYVLKKMDLKPKEGGITMELHPPTEMAVLADVMQQLMYDEYVSINQRKKRYDITKRGLEYIGLLIDEAERYIDEFDDEEAEDMVEELRERNIDVLRVRFLWGWYQGEFDDLTLFQERRGMRPVERLWPIFLMSDEFYANLALDVPGYGQD